MTGTLKPETKKQEPIYKSLVRLEIMLSHDPNELDYFFGRGGGGGGGRRK